uniref:Reverse transcriptase domain-containing protein n=1 Tax=Lactuca sativa TaxID=4236 RepID=A0A9R1W1Z6_LACSA|nr:hypothetical protein LSAT_V11C300120150 [Lactuca sativa]
MAWLLVLQVVESRLELNPRLATWKATLEEKGLCINIAKTKYRCYNFSGNQRGDKLEVCINDHVLHLMEIFRYLGSMSHKNEGVDDDVTHCI